MVGRKGGRREGGRVSNSSKMLFSMKIEEELPLLIKQNIHEWRFKGWVPGLAHLVLITHMSRTGSRVVMLNLLYGLYRIKI